MKHLFLFTFLLTSYFVSFAQTKLIIDHKGGTKDSIAVNSISQIRFSSSGVYQPSMLEVQQILDTTAAKFLQYADLTNGNPFKAIMLTEKWVRLQSNVQSVATLDSTYIDIILKSGLEADFFFNEIDDNGFSIFRGGGGERPAEAHISFDGLSKNTITNKKVLIYAPAWTEFNLQSTVPKTVSTLTNSGLGLDVTVLKDNDCTPAIANTFKDYGLVILDTHGMPDAYMSGTIINIAKGDTTEAQYKSSVIQQYGQDFYDRLLNKDYRRVYETLVPIYMKNWQKKLNLIAIEKVWVTTQYIKTLPSMPNSVIFGNMCYSGYSVAVPNRNLTYPIKTAFMDKSPISYYCFALDNGKSTPVTDNFSKDMEDTLTNRLVKDLDSTGVANLRRADGAEYYDPYLYNAGQEANVPPRHIILLFRHFGSDDYSYQKCGDTLIDTRDGQKYATVCIGKQKWMAKNLNYNAPGSITYDNNPANGTSYGRLYDFQTLTQGKAPTSTNPSGIQGVCPKGWHVPSQPEFQQMITTLGGAVAAGGAMKSISALWSSPNVGATNSSGFSALPGGYMVKDINGSPTYNFINTHAYIWTVSLGAPNFYQIYVLTNTEAVIAAPGATDKYSLSCRCLKD